MIRSGLGFDAHAFAEGDVIVLGGVSIAYERGLGGHSDADVLSHAIGDAVLGAAGLGDLGEMFPATDEWKNASSIDLLERIAARLGRAGWRLVNVDAVVIAAAPRVAPHRAEMATRLARALRVEVDAVSVKATTTDGMGFTGRSEGIACMATALVEHVG